MLRKIIAEGELWTEGLLQYLKDQAHYCLRNYAKCPDFEGRRVWFALFDAYNNFYEDNKYKVVKK